MTCIAGIVHDGKVYMGADSAAVDGYELYQRADSKVFINGEFLFGFTSSFRMGQLLRYKFIPPQRRKNLSVETFMVKVFVEKIRTCLKKGGFAERKNNVETGGTFIVGYKARLFTIERDFQVGCSIENFAAVGCGGSYARAVLWQLGNSRASPNYKILQALKAAEYFSAGVRRPFVIKCI